MQVERHKIVITIMVYSCNLFTVYHIIIIGVINVIDSCKLFTTCNDIMIAVLYAFTWA